jgi:hypothetical protein
MFRIGSEEDSGFWVLTKPNGVAKIGTEAHFWVNWWRQDREDPYAIVMARKPRAGRVAVKVRLWDSMNMTSF